MLLKLDSSIIANSNMFMFAINENEVANNLNLKDAAPGDIFYTVKSSKYNANKSNLSLNGVPLLVNKIGNLEETS